MIAPAAAVARERRISVGINALLSLAFFLLVFGLAPRALTFAAPDRLAFDFIPQSLAIGFFSALVPALIVGGKRRRGEIAGLDANAAAWPETVLRALGFAAAAGGSGALLALALPNLAGGMGYLAALGAKVVYGGALAWAITPLAVRLELR